MNVLCFRRPNLCVSFALKPQLLMPQTQFLVNGSLMSGSRSVVVVVSPSSYVRSFVCLSAPSTCTTITPSHTNTPILSRLIPTTITLHNDNSILTLGSGTMHCNTQQIWQTSRRYMVKGAKMGKHLKVLDEMAHQQERDAAEIRRQKVKDKKAAKKSGNNKTTATVDTNAKTDFHATSDSDHDDDEKHEEEEEDADDDHQSIDKNALPKVVDVKEKMMKHVQRFQDYLKTVQGAEPTPELFDNITVNAYGDPSTPLQAVAQIVLVSPTMATATCFDPALTKAVGNAIREKLSLNPMVDGSGEDSGVLQIPIPRVSMESRIQTSNTIKKRAELYRQRIRTVRRKYLEIVKLGVAGKLEHVSKDDAFRIQTEIETLTDQMIDKVNLASDKKQKTVMAV